MGAVAVPGTEAEGQDMGRTIQMDAINALAVMSSRLQDVPVDPFGVSPISCAAGLPDDGVGLSCGDIYQAIRRQW
jgi:hypothetical protein